MMLRWIKELFQLTCLVRSRGSNVQYRILGDQLEVSILTRNPKTFVIPRNENSEEKYQEVVNYLKEMVKA